MGRVFCLRVETTRWSLDHLVRWCAELQRGGARLLMLANLAIPEHPELPQAILDCGASLLGLYVFFFTVEAYHIAALVELRALGLYGCIEGHGMIDRVLHPESPIRKLAIHGGMGRTFAVAGATRLRSLVLFDNQVGTVAVDGAARFRNLYMCDTKPSRISIGAAPRLRRILCLDIFNTVLIGMTEPPPQIRSVRHLGLRVNYTEMDIRLPRLMEQILKSFPRRCDEVTQAEGLLQWNDAHYDGNNFFDGLESFNYHLRWIYLEDFRGGKCEVALMKAMLDKASVLRQLMIQYSTSSVPQLTLNQLDLSLRNFKLHTPNGVPMLPEVAYD
uniref:F-box/LRR-repeat protein 15/At3g58940/PEG3-like LRR domain-containing protein n=1 Tax=Oryza meridionalis TaxID=40149 RepID=A0A0E0FDU4_9ORYZ